MGFFARLKEGLTKTREGFVRNMDYLFGASSIDDDFYEELEEILIMGDLGVATSMRLIEHLREQVHEQRITDPKECRQLLIEQIKKEMDLGENAYAFEDQASVLMMVGVNGVGKTTTVGKLAAKFKQEKGKKVLVAAADTFRAAANEQLKEWCLRAGVEMIGGQEGSDPASVVYDALASAKARKSDILMVDTAGRLHNKTNLMHELEKINRVIQREFPEAYRETLVVLDATTGQNALVQAREFAQAADVTGIVLTKMDGSAKGGIAVAIQSELGIPVKYIGVGEKVEDLEKFNADEYVRALFNLEDETVANVTESAEAEAYDEDFQADASVDHVSVDTEGSALMEEAPLEEDLDHIEDERNLREQAVFEDELISQEEEETSQKQPASEQEEQEEEEEPQERGGFFSFFRRRKK